uniref:Uncharacterized protein n=2 Tax=Ursus TaxID=9639 RepID=A0A452V7G9_URSMA
MKIELREDKQMGGRLEVHPWLLLHDVTMAGLQELRFPEEKPLLRGQDAAELENSDTFLLAVDTDWKVGLRSTSQGRGLPAGPACSRKRVTALLCGYLAASRTHPLFTAAFPAPTLRGDAPLLP